MNAKFCCLAKDIFLNNFSDANKPYRITYILTYKCQCKCAMCNIWQNSGQNELSIEQITKFFKRSNGFSWINLSGGEIFLRKDFMEIIHVIYTYCKRLYLLDFPTNGFLSDVIADSVGTILRTYRVPKLFVTVSLDGPQILHDKIRGVTGAWRKAVETFDKLRAMRSGNFDVFLGMTLQPCNMEKFEETAAAVEDLIGRIRYRDFHVNIMQYSPHYYGNIHREQFEDKQELISNLERIRRLRKGKIMSPVAFLEEQYQRMAKKYLLTDKTPVLCQALCASFFMDPQGTVFPCSIYNKAIGNISDYDYNIYALWNTALRKQLRREIKEGKCPQCWTPCEAYQAILSGFWRGLFKGRK